ncbi:DNA polymerase III, clamp loader complex, gamma/delta/delta subunit [Mycena maculata]|uniref:DNA polymerase III, clamp loader complex, gamma/delta/delta subunit n=1 Tax=Mycena maculata TaxID=230809 RepID=A0AAD7I4C6_9AGAR|nr:DNA polymerase III, clamp loader complex, gamma/delta/delta subunit [Mycena maculata]
MHKIVNEPESPICSQKVDALAINTHIDEGCSQPSPVASSHKRSSSGASKSVSPVVGKTKTSKKSSSQLSNPVTRNIAPIFNIKPKGTEPSPGPSHSQAVSPPKRGPDDHNPREGPPLKRAKFNLQDAAPLAEKLRPTDISEFVGHESVVSLIASGCTGSLILWGPSGCGKTTLARIIATQSDAVFKELSATVAGINDVRAIVDAAKSTFSLTGRKTILFLDEIHRFNKGQQDIFLPFLERGYIQLIGATTENPSFKLIGALLSRCRVFCLERLEDADIRDIISKALIRLSPPSGESTVDLSVGSSSQPLDLEASTSALIQKPIRSLSEKIIATIVSMSAGDARIAISLLELAIKAPIDFDEAKVLTFLRRSVATSYDPAEDHYNMISALHKSVRGSQPDAAMYWLARMLAGGEDPGFICRRMVVCASEDIGLADNHALPLAVATLHACQNIGMPECRINLAHLIAYLRLAFSGSIYYHLISLSEAPKSTRAYEAYRRAEEAAERDPSLPVPLQMRNAPTALMKEVGYGKSYHYNPDYAHPVHNTYLPSQLEGTTFLKKAGDVSGKTWDEEALINWENYSNGGKQWDGREMGEQSK